VEKQSFEQSGWQLDELLPTPEGEELDRALDELEEQVQRFEDNRDLLTADIDEEQFLELMQHYESIRANVRRLYYYGYLWLAEDTQHQPALSFLGRIKQLAAELENRTLFFTLWWKKLDDDVAQRLLDVSGDYAYYLESLRRYKPYTLSESEEKILNLKNINGSDALVNLYQMITNRFSFRLEVDGEVKELTRDELSAYARDPSPNVRAAAYREMYDVYSNEGSVLAQIYSHIVRDWANENLTLRGYASPIAVRNLYNDIPDTVVDTLLDVCRRNMDLFHRYFRLKAEWLGVDRLRRYDVYAPVRAAEREIPFPEAADMVLDGLNRFSPTLGSHALRVLADEHVDSEIRPGKRGGAFCASALPGMAPWVLLNYVGRVDNVLTLAHELGHAMHALMAQEHSVLTFHSTLPLAETASVFSEMILVDRWLEEETDPAVRRDLLALVLDEAYATIARQAYFVLFEKKAHPLAREGATLDELNALYLENLHEQFGDAVDVSDDFRWEWTAIPHIYNTPFYCYAYSFGHLLVLALYRQYKQEGEPFIPRYLKILSYGGSESPGRIISEAGFDMADADFWQGGFEVLRGMLDELESL
jgi:oligoendopeptidase F